MTKKCTYTICGVLAAMMLVAFPGGLQAQEAGGETKTAEGGYKIAVVEMQTLLSEYDKRKEKYDALQEEVDERQKGIDELSAKIEAAKKRYEEEGDEMAEEERFELKNQIESDYATYRSELEKHQRYIDNQEERVLKEVLKDIHAAIAEVGEKENYHLILSTTSGPRGGVLYHHPTIDITSKVLATLNQ